MTNSFAKRKMTYALVAGLLASSVMPGCISRRAYEANMASVMRTLDTERREKNEAIAKLEQKVQDRGRSLNELTAKYMDLQKEHEKSQIRFHRLKSDLDALLRDMAELKMVVFANVKGTQANEMMIKLMEMQNRIQLMLGKAAETPAEEEAAPEAVQPAR
ncbi:MAG: hypothetical protein HY893_08620 [Deltaproteobacteria bacterium]|nr:hypothetical protein [Deltaproteobacteria bacterium]